VRAISSNNHGQGGFSLLEIIVTIIVASILGAILVQFVGTSMIHSVEPVIMAQEGFSLSNVMEKMTADYRRLFMVDQTPLETFKTYVENGNDSNNTPYYGQYSIQTQYILFQGGSEIVDTSGDNKVLKITITDGGQSLTSLFVK
jgi:prepilin-type N-terminal cleavage/methylation domain-containing protein